jgi:ABC-type nitrate/sulfonate/bicarbonate transport system permease component
VHPDNTLRKLGAITFQRIVPILLFILLWQAVGSARLVNTAFLPSPIQVARALADLLAGPEIRNNLLATLERTFVGLAFAILAGVGIGLGMARSAAFRGYVSPLVGATYSLPKTALVPLLILWFGVGNTMAIIAVFLTGLLPIIVHTSHGVAATPDVLVWSAQAMGASRRQVLWRIFLPHALPDIFTGIRVALGFSFVVAVSAEMIASTAGIGRLTFMYGENGSYDYMFAAVASIITVAFLADRALLALSLRALRWHAAGER